MRKHKALWRLVALGLASVMLFAACKGTDESPADMDLSSQESPSPSPSSDPYTVEPSSADAVLEAYLLCLKDGETEKAQQYVWPMAESQAGASTRNFWQPFEDAGYPALESYQIDKAGESDLYTMYNVSLTFTMPGGMERSGEVVAAGDTIFMPPAAEEIRAAQEAEASAAAESANGQANAETDTDEETASESSVAQDQALSTEESGEHASADESNGAENAEASDETAAPDEEAAEIQPAGYEVMLLTVVHADGRYYVSPENLLAVYEATDTSSRMELETRWAQEVEQGLAEVEGREAAALEAPEIDGVYAQLMSARRYADGISMDIRLENYDQDAYAIGEEEFPPILEMEAVFLGLDPYASPQLATDFGLTPLSPDAGAKAGHFDTFAPSIVLEPGNTLMENIRFVGNYEIIYSLFFPDFDGSTLPVAMENMEALPGYLPVRNPFADFAAPEEGFGEGDEA